MVGHRLLLAKTGCAVILVAYDTLISTIFGELFVYFGEITAFLVGVWRGAGRFLYDEQIFAEKLYKR
ncbi:MAG: hypothetical protein Q4B81_01910 [Moraxella sp.]|nr:hypothetical protein [Moraxella sp.]